MVYIQSMFQVKPHSMKKPQNYSTFWMNILLLHNVLDNERTLIMNYTHKELFDLFVADYLLMLLEDAADERD